MKAKPIQLSLTLALVCFWSSIIPVPAQQEPTQNEWIDLLSDHGEVFIGHQLESFIK